MKPNSFRLTVLAAGLVLAAAPAFAQGRPAPSSGSTSGGGGQAVDRGGGGSSSSSGGGSTSSSGSSGTVSSGGYVAPSGSAASAPMPGSGAVAREAAPQHRTTGGGAASGSRGGSHASSGDNAVPRGSVNSGSSSSSNTSPSRAASPNSGTHDQAVPSWGRPRGDRPGTDTAIERTTLRPPNGGSGGYYPPYYGPGYPYYGYGYGGYYGYYSPYWDYAAACGYGFGYGFGYGSPLCYAGVYDPFLAGGMGYYGGGGYYGGASSGQASYSAGDQGKLRLKIKPKDAKVYVDGYFTGTVNDMDGAFQKLPLAPGRHHVEVKADGYQPEAFEVVIPPNETVTFQGALKKIQ